MMKVIQLHMKWVTGLVSTTHLKEDVVETVILLMILQLKVVLRLDAQLAETLVVLLEMIRSTISWIIQMIVVCISFQMDRMSVWYWRPDYIED